MARRLRVGAVAYLNARPLVWGLAQGWGAERLELVEHVPAALAELLGAGELDLALLPVIELARLPGLEIVPGLAVGSAGPARSVLLVSSKPLTELESVALDPESRTSNALVQVLLAERWHSRARCEPGPLELDAALATHDAVLRIGDKALFEPLPAGTTAHDLGEAWTEATGLPFVYAVWAARPGTVDRPLYQLLHASRRAGLREIDRIAEEYVWHGRRDPALAREYLSRHIRYRLGSSEVRGMQAFFAAAARLGLIERMPRAAFALPRVSACQEVVP